METGAGVRAAGAHTDPRPCVTSVNVGGVREVMWRGTPVRTAIWKAPVGTRPVEIRGVNLAGDDQADRGQHGGPDKAVYAYAEEDYGYWSDAEHVDTGPGLFGENLTLRGMDLRNAVVGERWLIGTAVLEVAQPRLPCFKLGIRMEDARFPRRFQAAGRPGAYLRLIEEGAVRAADPIVVVDRPRHGVTLRQMLDALGDPRRAAALLVAPQLPDVWRRLAPREGSTSATVAALAGHLPRLVTAFARAAAATGLAGENAASGSADD